MLRLVRRRELPGLVLVVACFVLPLGLFVVDAVRMYDRTLDEATQDIQNTASIFEQHVRSTFETDHPQIGQLAMPDATGFIRVRSFQVRNQPPNFEDRNFFTQIRDITGLILSVSGSTRVSK
jgi:hypothetical protein